MPEPTFGGGSRALSFVQLSGGVGVLGHEGVDDPHAPWRSGGRSEGAGDIGAGCDVELDEDVAQVRLHGLL